MKLATEKSRKMIMKGSRMESKGSQMATKIEPKGCQMAARMAHKPIQNDPGTLNWTSPATFQFWDSFWMHLGAAQGSTSVPKSAKVPWKSYQKINTKNDVEKVVILVRKSSQIYPKTCSKVEQTCRTNRNLRFLCFCKEYNVKIVFWDDQGHRNRPQNW